MNPPFFNFLSEYFIRNNTATIDDVNSAKNALVKYLNQYTSIKSEPFQFFKWFFMHDGYILFIEYFKTIPELFPVSVIEQKLENTSWKLVVEDLQGKLENIEVSFKNELKQLFTVELNKSIELLAQLRKEVIGVKNKKLIGQEYLKDALLTGVIDESKITNQAFCHYLEKFHERFILLINQMLQKESSKKVSKTKSFRIINNKENRVILSRVYQLSFGESGFIDRTRTDLNTFINFFLSKEPHKYEKAIFTYCNVNVAAYILSKMKRLFPGIEWENIEESKCIIKKTGAPFKASDISTGKGRRDKFSGDIIKEVDTFFSNM